MDPVTICNMALMAAGIPAITSFEETNNNAKLCKSFYPILRDQVLRDHTWSFATAYADLQELAEPSPDTEYPCQCALPADCVRIISLQDRSPYRCTGRKILLQHYPATLVYIRQEENCGLYDAAFVDALKNLLAAEIALSASRDIQMAQYFRNEYRQALVVARSIDSQENHHANQPGRRNSSFLAARCHGSPRQPGKIVFVEGDAGKQGA